MLPSSGLSIKRSKSYGQLLDNLQFLSYEAWVSLSSSFDRSSWVLSWPLVVSAPLPHFLDANSSAVQAVDQSINQSLRRRGVLPASLSDYLLHLCHSKTDQSAAQSRHFVRHFLFDPSNEHFSTLRDRLNHESSRPPSPVARPGLPFLLPFLTLARSRTWGLHAELLQTSARSISAHQLQRCNWPINCLFGKSADPGCCVWALFWSAAARQILPPPELPACQLSNLPQASSSLSRDIQSPDHTPL